MARSWPGGCRVSATQGSSSRLLDADSGWAGSVEVRLQSEDFSRYVERIDGTLDGGEEAEFAFLLGETAGALALGDEANFGVGCHLTELMDLVGVADLIWVKIRYDGNTCTVARCFGELRGIDSVGHESGELLEGCQDEIARFLIPSTDDDLLHNDLHSQFVPQLYYRPMRALS